MSVENRLKIVLCPGRFPDKKHQETYNKIYQCWREVWEQTFLEVDEDPTLYSDAFTRQDIISAIFLDDDCKAVCLFRYADAKMISTRQDSYFKNWSETHLHKLFSKGPNILVSSYLTVHPSARKTTTGVPMVELLVALGTEVYLQSNADAMTGAMRKNRKAHDVTYHWGADPVAYDIPSGHGDLVDLVAFFRENVVAKKIENPLTAIFEKLWSECLVIKQQIPESVDVFEYRRDSQLNINQNKKAA